jgi:hypothetical protein
LSAVFPKWFNRLPLIVLFVKGGGAVFGIGFIWYYFSPIYTDVGYAPKQPVPYSHKFHAGDLGIDCRYCHTGVETGPHANIPAVQTCMNCHSKIKLESEKLLPVRLAFNTEATDEETPLEWIRIHKIPDFVRFRHDVHINAGVSCYSCHGRIDQLVVVRQEHPLSMSWCLDCHRDPEPNLVPRDMVTRLGEAEEFIHNNQGVEQNLKDVHDVAPPTNCSACHF